MRSGGNRFVMFPRSDEEALGVTLVTLETGFIDRLRAATSAANR